VTLGQRLLEKVFQDHVQLAETAQHGTGDESGKGAVTRLHGALCKILGKGLVERTAVMKSGRQQPHGGLARGEARRQAGLRGFALCRLGLAARGFLLAAMRRIFSAHRLLAPGSA